MYLCVLYIEGLREALLRSLLVKEAAQVLILDHKREMSCQKDKTLVQKQGSGSSSVPFFWLLAV